MSNLNTENSSALIIGANGGIGLQLSQQIVNSSRFDTVYGVSRQDKEISDTKHIRLASHGESEIREALEIIPNGSLSLIICCIGILHDESLGISPEKSVSDINERQLAHYFQINSIIPALWVKALRSKVIKKARSNLVFLSARVSSCKDNRLGGWYGYRASKAALNSMIISAQVEYRRTLPQCQFTLYHPGTVDTSLSKPFQRNVPKDKLFTPEFTSTQLLALIDKWDLQPQPHFVDWAGKSIDW